MARDVTVNVRLAEPGLAAIDKMAADEERTRSNMIRVLLQEAIKTRMGAKK